MWQAGGWLQLSPQQQHTASVQTCANSLYHCHPSGWSPGCFLFWMQQTLLSCLDRKYVSIWAELLSCHIKTRYYFFTHQKRPWIEGADILQRCSEERFWRSSTPKQSTTIECSPSRVSENLQGYTPAVQKFWECEARLRGQQFSIWGTFWPKVPLTKHGYMIFSAWWQSWKRKWRG